MNIKSKFFFKDLYTKQKMVIGIETCRQFAYPVSDFVQQPEFVNICPKL